MLSSRPTQVSLQPTPLAEALLHRHRTRSAAAALNVRNQRFRILWLAARACFASWRTSQPPIEQLRAGGLGVVVFAANTGRTAARAIGRGSSSPTPNQVGGCGFETSHAKLSPSPARGPLALRPVGNLPTAHRADACWRTWRGCLRSQHGAHCSPRHRPRLFFTDTESGRRLRLRNVACKAFAIPCARPARASPCRKPANRPQSRCVLADLAWLSSQPTRGALHPTLLAEVFILRHTEQTSIRGYETSWQ